MLQQGVGSVEVITGSNKTFKGETTNTLKGVSGHSGQIILTLKFFSAFSTGTQGNQLPVRGADALRRKWM